MVLKSHCVAVLSHAVLACGRLVNSSGSYQVHTHTAKNTEGVRLYWVEDVNEEEKALLQVFLHQRHSVQIYCVLFLFIFFIIILFLLKNIPEFHTHLFSFFLFLQLLNQTAHSFT